MRAKLWFVLMFVLLIGCGQNEESSALPTRAQSVLDVPRGIPDTPTPSLPATWTPAPTPLESTPIPASASGEGETTEASTNGNEKTHVVQAGETLGEIATQYGVSLSELADANGIDNIDVIEVGTVLVIPGG